MLLKNFYRTAIIQNIPQETDILITHQPPLGILDYADYGLGANHQGDPVLAKRVREVKPIYGSIENSG